MISILKNDFPFVVAVPRGTEALVWLGKRFGRQADWVMGLTHDTPSENRYQYPAAGWDVYSSLSTKQLYVFFKEFSAEVVEFKLRFG